MLQIKPINALQSILAPCLILGLFGCANPQTIPDVPQNNAPVEAEETQSESTDDSFPDAAEPEASDSAEETNTTPEESDPNSAAEPSDDRVELVVFTESLCPCAAQWVWDLSEHVLPAVGDILRVERYLDGSAHEDGSVSVFHGSSELRSQTYEVCVQHIADSLTGDGFLQSLAWTACINGECSGPGGSFGLEYCDHQGMLGEGDGTENAEACAADLELPWEEIHTCATGELGQSLHWESSSFGNNNGVTYGMQGLPVVWLNAERISSFWDCNSYSTQMRPLISAICDAYEGNEKPEACITPQ